MKWDGWKKLWELLSGEKKKTAWMLAIGILGIVLIGLSELLPDHSEQEQKQEEPLAAAAQQSYEEEMEQRLLPVLEQIKGVGKTELLITVEYDVENIYAMEETHSLDKTGEDALRESSAQSYVLVDSREGSQPLLLTRKEPEVKGVVVVCDGGGDPVVKQAVTEAVATAFRIPVTRICVVPRTG